MKNKTEVAIGILILVLVAAGIVAQTNKIYLKKLVSCNNVSYSIIGPVYGNCTRDYPERVCQDPPLNTTCQDQIKTHNYRCQTGTTTVQKSSLDCSPKSFEISRELNALKQKIEFLDWGMCSQEGENVIICDSKFDGNNDGKCSSGESCMKFVVNLDGIDAYTKNSRDDWVLDDNSFFLGKLQAVEVAK